MTNPLPVLLAVLLLAASALGEVLRVPQDHPTIQKAVEAASDGDEIVVSKGTYGPVSIVALDGLTLRAAGKVLLSPSGAEGGQPLLTVAACSQVLVRGLRLEGAAGVAALVQGSSDVRLEKLRISEAAAEGVALVDSSDVVLERCRVAGCGGDGIAITKSQAVSVTRCVLTDVAASGVNVLESSQVLVEKTRIERPGTNGVRLAEDASGNSVVECRIKRPGDDGVEVRGDDNLVERSRVLQSGDDAFVVPQASVGAENLFRDNRAVRPGFRGFVLGGSLNTLEGNRCIRAGDDAYVLAGTGSHQVRGNKAVRPAFDGFWIFDTSVDCTLEDNRVSRPADDGVDVQALGTVVRGTRVSGAADNGFEVNAAGNNFEDNRAKGSKTFDLFDDSGGPNNYTGNVFKTSNIDV